MTWTECAVPGAASPSARSHGSSVSSPRDGGDRGPAVVETASPRLQLLGWWLEWIYSSFLLI